LQTASLKTKQAMFRLQ